MFLNSLKATSITRKIDKHLRDRSYESLKKEPMSICILQRQSEAFNPTFIADLKKAVSTNSSVSVDTISYVDEILKEEKDNVWLFSDKEIGWNGVLKSKGLKNFSRKRYDILISYYEREEIALQLLTALSQASFRVGVSVKNQYLNDLTIQTGVGAEENFIKELKKYLKILKTY